MLKQNSNFRFSVLVALSVAAIALKFVFTQVHSVAITSQYVAVTGEHEYHRPRGREVSGFKGSNAKYHRSPCPALNALANHGYIPRDGKDLIRGDLQVALAVVYNIDPALAALLVGDLPAQFSLADLAEHNVIEHDASLVHDDAWRGGDPSVVNATLADRLFALVNSDGRLTKTALASFRRDRESDSAANSPEFAQTFTFKRRLTTFSETAALLLVIGDDSTSSMSVEHARSFLVDERIPDDYEKPAMPVTLFWALWLTAELEILASLGSVLV